MGNILSLSVRCMVKDLDLRLRHGGRGRSPNISFLPFLPRRLTGMPRLSNRMHVLTYKPLG